MNTFEIKIQETMSESRMLIREIHIIIDGRDLIDILKEYELPMAKGEGHPDLAGSYSALTLGSYDREYGKRGSHDRAYFLGESERDYGKNGDKTAVLECLCGWPGCWPFAVKISLLQDVVMWSDFEQPHRSWDYSKLGPFRFDLQEYQAQLLKVQESA